MALELSERVSRWTEEARGFFYSVVLCGHVCPDCGGALVMVRESLCRCEKCSGNFDPTIRFQRCTSCGGQLVVCIRRYQCRQCAAEVPSRFLFDGCVFDSEYFRRRVAESRQRREESRERVREMLAASRSRDLVPPPADLASVPGLIDALNGLTGGLEPVPQWLPPDDFDLARYERHLQTHVGSIAVQFDDLPRLSENSRQDRIWRFIALVFLDQAGLLELRQEGPCIWVRKRENDREGQGVPAETEAVA